MGLSSASVLLSSAAAPASRPVRWAPLAVLAAAVLAGHAWLATLLAPAQPRLGQPQGAPVLLRAVPVPVSAPPAPLLVPARQPMAPHEETSAAAVPPQPVRSAEPPTTSAPVPPAFRLASAPIAAVGDVASAPAAEPSVPSLSAEGDPPPLHATRIPPPVQLRYALHHHGRSIDALLDWQHDGSSYRLALLAAAPAGLRAPFAQTSSGAIGADGLAPERFVDRRAAGAQRAANFRRDIGRIGYSGPSHQHPAWPGAQDRLSWLAQLVAILAADPAPPPVLTLFVADATGQAGLWHLQRQPDAIGPTPWGDQPLQHWRREAPRPEALQVDVWLALPAVSPGAVSAAAGWPLRVRFSVPRSGDVLELALQAPP